MASNLLFWSGPAAFDRKSCAGFIGIFSATGFWFIGGIENAKQQTATNF